MRLCYPNRHTLNCEFMKFRFFLITFLLFVWKISDFKCFLKSEFTTTSEIFNVLTKVFLELCYPNRHILNCEFMKFLFSVITFFSFALMKSDFKGFFKSEFAMTSGNFSTVTKVLFELCYPNRNNLSCIFAKISIFRHNFPFIGLIDFKF